MKISVIITLKKDVLDPQGKAISNAAHSLNIKKILEIKQGKYFEVTLDNLSEKKNAELIGKRLSENLLCNQVIEDYKIISIKKI